ncbi:MAG TPA: hypothetical protein VEA63_01570 [Opitutus sp.]|nr:hypothetical protein [Opitutus sp.]
MIRHFITFLATFVVGAVVAFAARAALHQPHTEATPLAAAEPAPMVDNALTPPKQKLAAGKASETKAKEAKGDEGHGEHAKAEAPKAEAEAKKPVNTVCAICGMDVDPKLPTEEYKGQAIGFGCRMCPPKFRADPDKYGPYYLRNEVIQR